MGFDYAGKIRALLSTADSHEAAGNESAAATFRAKAMEWMGRYRIAEEDALAVDPTSVEPVYRIIDLAFRPSDISHNLPCIADLLARHCEVRLHYTRPNWTTYRFEVVGYEGDVRYFELLWTSAYLMFATRIDPVWDDTISPEENIHRLRRAGHTRKEIAFKAGWDGEDAKARSRVQRIYVTQAKAAGEDPVAAGLGFQARDYRSAYSQAFYNRLSRRLREARDAANAAGGVVVLAGRSERVQEAFYAHVPAAQPSQDVSTEFVDPRANCAKCKAAKSGFCREHDYLKPRAWTQADEARWQRQQYGQSAQAGRASGREAADGVALRGTSSPTANRLDASNRALEG
jgi:hypothetical protein